MLGYFYYFRFRQNSLHSLPHRVMPILSWPLSCSGPLNQRGIPDRTHSTHYPATNTFRLTNCILWMPFQRIQFHNSSLKEFPPIYWKLLKFWDYATPLMHEIWSFFYQFHVTKILICVYTADKHHLTCILHDIIQNVPEEPVYLVKEGEISNISNERGWILNKFLNDMIVCNFYTKYSTKSEEKKNIHSSELQLLLSTCAPSVSANLKLVSCIVEHTCKTFQGLFSELPP
jgi:hypothetical protein